MEVAEKCNVILERVPFLPKFPLLKERRTQSWFRHQVLEGAKKLAMYDPIPKEPLDFEYEMSVIIQQGFLRTS